MVWCPLVWKDNIMQTAEYFYFWFIGFSDVQKVSWQLSKFDSYWVPALL